MFGDGALTFREFVTREPLPLATVHDAVLAFLRGREDAAVFGAHAVNAYVDEPRMTQAVDLLSTHAPELSAELRDHLADHFEIAVRVRHLGEERGFRLYQVQKPRNRHLVDVRPVDALPATRTFAEILVVAPAQLVASKVISLAQRKGRPKSGTDWRDIALLLLTFPDLKSEEGEVLTLLEREGAGPEALETWRELVAQEITLEDDD
jgi:hypothetical protein